MRNGKHFTLFGDRATIHSSIETTALLKRYKTEMILNVVAAPWLNPIEETFSVIKRYYRGLRIDTIVLKTTRTPKQLLEEASTRISLESINN